MATKRNNKITAHQAKQVFHARRYGEWCGFRWNLFVTINFAMMGLVDSEAQDCLGRLWANFGRWWRDQNTRKDRNLGPFNGFAVMENPDDVTHVHWCLAIPEHMRDEVERILRKKLLRLVAKMLPDAVPELPQRAFLAKKVKKSGRLVKYMMKGMDPVEAARFFTKHVPQGTLTGRRVKITRSLTIGARERDGWTPRIEPGERKKAAECKRELDQHPLKAMFAAPMANSLFAITSSSGMSSVLAIWAVGISTFQSDSMSMLRAGHSEPDTRLLLRGDHPRVRRRLRGVSHRKSRGRCGDCLAATKAATPPIRAAARGFISSSSYR